MDDFIGTSPSCDVLTRRHGPDESVNLLHRAHAFRNCRFSQVRTECSSSTIAFFSATVAEDHGGGYPVTRDASAQVDARRWDYNPVFLHDAPSHISRKR
jgi:hypothetical protein